jgi:tRNA G10  N-methylase Trm11
MNFLIRFFADYPNFRTSEIESAAKAENIKIKFLNEMKDEVRRFFFYKKEIYLNIQVENEDCLKRLISRCVLIK